MKPPIFCYFCHEIGHKSPDCPQKLSSHNDQKSTILKYSNNTPTNTKLAVSNKEVSKPKCFRVAVHSMTWRTQGAVNGTPTEIMGDNWGRDYGQILLRLRGRQDLLCLHKWLM